VSGILVVQDPELFQSERAILARPSAAALYDIPFMRKHLAAFSPIGRIEGFAFSGRQVVSRVGNCLVSKRVSEILACDRVSKKQVLPSSLLLIEESLRRYPFGLLGTVGEGGGLEFEAKTLAFRDVESWICENDGG